MVFKVEKEDLTIEDNPKSTCLEHNYIWHIHVPVLEALSVEYFVAQYGPLTSLFDDTDYYIKGNNIVVYSQYSSLDSFGPSGMLITLHYHGIRDYGLLFPWVANIKLRNRIGGFYEEAERNFEQGAWLSFALMCGAVFEGMLYAKLNMPSSNRFKDMTIEAYENKKIIDLKQKQIMDDARNARNLIHANRFNKNYITRKKAMDIMTTMNKLIKQFAY